MLIRQLSVFAENRIGSVSEILDILRDSHINIEALSVAETEEYGIIRMIVDLPSLAAERLSEAGIVVVCTEVIAVSMENVPGGLANIADKLLENGISVDYLYAFVASPDEGARLVIKTADNEKALAVLENKDK